MYTSMPRVDIFGRGGVRGSASGFAAIGDGDLGPADGVLDILVRWRIVGGWYGCVRFLDLCKRHLPVMSLIGS